MTRAIAACVLSTVFLISCTGPAEAHLVSISYSTIVAHDDTVDYELKFAAHLIPGAEQYEGQLTRQKVLAFKPNMLGWFDETIQISRGDLPCKPELLQLIGPDSKEDLIASLRYTCESGAGVLRIYFTAFAEDDRSQNIASLEIDGEKIGYVFSSQSPVMIYRATEQKTSQSFREFFALGVEHIWTGYDHLLFLIALLLPGGTFVRLAGIVTAFTIAHSVTLAMSALDIVALPSAPVEILIAATIIWAASLSLRASTGDSRWRLTFLLGLIHGFGFAGILKGVGLGGGNIVVPLLAFNAGVEVGQLVVVAVAVPVISLLARSAYGASLKRGIAWLIVGAGVFWLAERTASLLGA
jgi:hypothetical protein